MRSHRLAAQYPMPSDRSGSQATFLLRYFSMFGAHSHDLTSVFVWFFCSNRVVTGQHGSRPPRPRRARPLEIYFIDVEGGAATLLVTPERESILIDSGWPGNDDRDPKRIVHVLKDLAGCDQLDHLVTTHWHTDHFGGVAGLARLVEIAPFLGPRTARGSRMPALTFPTGPGRTIPWGSPTARPARASGRHSMPVIHCRSRD